MNYVWLLLICIGKKYGVEASKTPFTVQSRLKCYLVIWRHSEHRTPEHYRKAFSALFYQLQTHDYKTQCFKDASPSKKSKKEEELQWVFGEKAGEGRYRSELKYNHHLPEKGKNNHFLLFSHISSASVVLRNNMRLKSQCSCCILSTFFLKTMYNKTDI